MTPPAVVENVKAAAAAHRAVDATLQESAALSHREPAAQRGGGGARTRIVAQNNSGQRIFIGALERCGDLSELDAPASFKDTAEVPQAGAAVEVREQKGEIWSI